MLAIHIPAIDSSSTGKLEDARKGKSKRSIADLKASKRGGNAEYQPSFIGNDVFNFGYYDSNDKLRVDDKAILRMNPNSGNSESWQGASYFFEWKKNGFMCGRDEQVWLSSLTPSKSAKRGFGKDFKSVKYTGEYKDRDRLLWKEAMQELQTQTANRKAARKKEEESIARFLSERENEILEEKRQLKEDEKQAKMAKKATELRRTVRTLNREAAADAGKGGKGLGKKPKATEISQSTGAREASKPRGNNHRREDQTTGTDQSSKAGRREKSPKQDKDRRR
ncbi:hypothetical protein EAE96_010364 [Botrytis aclada]|nr:hypothetical protein EAE96_010364 [Botrytis aclada]